MWSWHYASTMEDSAGRYSKHVYLDDTRIVTKVVKASASLQTSTQEETAKQYYYHSDHLGSASLISDYQGREYERLEYTPYGEIWIDKSQAASEMDVPFRFTGKERDVETGLYYYGARYLDSRTSRWLSTDPALGEYIPQAPINDEARKHNQSLPGQGGIFNTVNTHLYHYAGNNPVRYTDPDGEASISAVASPGVLQTIAKGAIAVLPYLVAAAPYAAVGVAIVLAVGVVAVVAVDAYQQSQGDKAQANSQAEQAGQNVQKKAQGAVPSAQQPEGQNSNDNDEDHRKKPTQRDLNEAKRQYATNKDFRRHFHRNYKPDMNVPTNKQRNPDMKPQALWDAWQDYKTLHGME
jgi:RHS repeat-associated protein